MVKLDKILKLLPKKCSINLLLKIKTSTTSTTNTTLCGKLYSSVRAGTRGLIKHGEITALEDSIAAPQKVVYQPFAKNQN